MKILLVSPLPPPIGGIASWSVNLLNYLSISKKEYEICHQNSAIKFGSITNTNQLSRILSGFVDSYRIIRELIHNVRKYQPDIIHLTSSASLALIKDLIILQVSKKNKIPLIIHWRFGRIPELAVKKNWEWKLLFYIVKNLEYSIVIDNNSYKTIRSMGIRHVINIPNPIPVALEQKAEILLKEQERKIQNQLIFVGNVIKSKGLIELVESCVQLDFVNHLLIIGPYEIQFERELKKIAQKRNTGSWLNLTGPLDKEKIMEEMSNSSILVIPSHSEGFPNVVVEAMAMGCAVIATDVGAIPEMLDIKSDKPCGLCIPPYNVEKLKDAIEFLINNPLEAGKMAKNGIERVVNNYTMDIVMKQYEAVWEKASG